MLRTAFVNDRLAGREIGSDAPIGETDFGGVRVPVVPLSSLPPGLTTTGAIESMAPPAGQSAGQVHELRSAAEIVRECMREARAIVERLPALVEGPGAAHAARS